MAVARRAVGEGPMATFEHAVARLERLTGPSAGAGRAGRRLTLPVSATGESGARRSVVRPPTLSGLAAAGEKAGSALSESQARSPTEELLRELRDAMRQTQSDVQTLLARPRRAVFG